MKNPAGSAGFPENNDALGGTSDFADPDREIQARSTAANASHRERDDDYARAVARLAPRWRVVECKDGLQWILQRRTAAPPAPGRWRGVQYFRTRVALIAAGARFAGPLDPAALTRLAALPDVIGREVAR